MAHGLMRGDGPSATFGQGGGEGTSSLYFNSMEPTGPNDVLTDDFWRGNWYVVDGDSTDWRTVPPGWGGTIFGNPITPAGAVRDLQSIGKKPLFTASDYVATSGVITPGNNARNHAFHNLSGADSGGHAEIFVRYYTYFVEEDFYGAGDPADSYTWGGQKHVEFNRFGDDGGLYWGGTGLNIGGGGGQASALLNAVNNHGPGGGEILHQNQDADLPFAPGNWYFVEIRWKLNTVGNADGIYQLWINDGGPTGDFSAQTPTLRTEYTDVDFGRDGDETQLLGNVWLENWSNAIDSPSLGEQFWANVKVATAGPIGFVE